MMQSASLLKASIILWVSLCVALCVERRALDLSQESLSLYTDVHEIDRNASYLKIRSLPIVFYKFRYDSVADRVQLGVVGAEAQKLFPESIEVLPSTVFSAPANTSAGTAPGKGASAGRQFTPTVVTNFPVVDKNVIFMHGLAAVQQLIDHYESLQLSMQTLADKDQLIQSEFDKLESLLNREAQFQYQEKLAAARKELELVQQQREAAAEKSRQEAQRQQQQLAEEKSLLEYEEKLARERLVQQEEVTRAAMNNQLQLERTLAEKKESLQRSNAARLQAFRQEQTQELESKRLTYEKEKIRAEIEAKAQQERINEEIAIRKIQTQSKLDTERMVQGIKSVSVQLSGIFRDVFAQPKQLLILAGIFLALIASYFLIREFSAMIRQFIQNRIGKPSLVRETSFHWSPLPRAISDARDALWLLLSGQSSAEKSAARLQASMQQLAQDFQDVILCDEDKTRVLQLALATRNTRSSGAPYRHVLLHGPPGTGKTLIARRLAASSGMDYAILSGGDVAPLGEDAVNQLHALFRWANRSQRGLLVFIDEAEAFLSSRTNALGGESHVQGAGDAQHLRNSLNALLYQTGTPSHTFMMVLATNRPEDLDSAILDRIDVSIPVSLPQEPQRVQLIQLYMNSHLLQPAARSQQRSTLARLFSSDRGIKYVDEECLLPQHVANMARTIAGFSGREISKLFISAQYAMFLAAGQRLTWSLLKQTVDAKLEEHRMKSSGFVSTSTGSGGLSAVDNDGDPSNEAVGGTATKSPMKNFKTPTKGKKQKQ